MKLTRRPFLKFLIPAALGATVVLSAGTLVAWPHRKNLYRRYIRHVPERTSGSLDDEELRYVMAFAEVIYPPSDDEQTLLLHNTVATWATRRAAEDGYLPVYRDGVDALRRAANYPRYEKAYCDLSWASREHILRDLMLEGETGGDLFDLSPGHLGAMLRHASFFLIRDYWHVRYLMEDLALGIYSSALGWALVEYSGWPGAPGPLLEYTRPPRPVNDVR